MPEHVTGKTNSPDEFRVAEDFSAYSDLVGQGKQDEAKRQYPDIAAHLATGCVGCNQALKGNIRLYKDVEGN